MTRETKIGLLIGLGFIVVFAVLLSQTSPPVSVVDPRPLAMGSGQIDSSPASPGGVLPDEGRLPVGLHEREAAAEADTPSGVPAPEVPSQPQPEPDDPSFDPIVPERRDVLVEAPRGRQEPGAASDLLAGLPRPVILDGALRLAGRKSSGKSTGEGAPRLAGAKDVRSPAGTRERSVLRRVAPPRLVITAEHARTGKDARAAVSVAERDGKSKKLAEAVGSARRAPAAPDPQAKEYVVQKGDTVVKIVRANYGSASPRKVDFFLASNQGRIRDKNTIFAGQKLLIPKLPPELFEPAPEFDVRGVDGGAPAVTADQLAEGKRQAPPTDAPSKKAPQRAAGESAPKVRLYEIQPNDTLVSIARRELGSSSYWKQIQKLNPGINPRKMRPGTKIRLPARPPVSDRPQNRQERV